MQIPQKPPEFKTLLEQSGQNSSVFLMNILEKVKTITYKGEYYHWDELRHQDLPHDITLNELWAGLRFRRMGSSREIPLQDKKGMQFSFCCPDHLQEVLAFINSNASGRIQTSDQITNTQTRDRYLISSTIEEAIRSSQLEGAATTRKIAKEMIRSGRKPADRGENMILNNFRTMQHIRTLKDRPLTPAIVLDIHRRITENTLDHPDEAGRLRTKKDGLIQVVQDHDNEVLHDPPSADELPDRMNKMCDFANRSIPDYYIHPVLRAVILHFWLSYDHPFTDGNGRTARALFYWLMLREEYWLIEFISISRILRNAPSQYARSFLFTETDANDLTYFLIYNVRVIQRAINDLFKYIENKIKEIRILEQKSKILLKLNHRQKALISHALRNPSAVYTYTSHKQSHNVTFQTARTDLMKLAELGLLRKDKIGRAHHYFPSDSLPEKLMKW